MLVGMLQSVVRAGVTEGLRAPCAAAPLRHPTSGGRALDRQPIKTEAVRMNGLLALGVIVAGALPKQTLGSAFTIMPRGFARGCTEGYIQTTQRFTGALPTVEVRAHCRCGVVRTRVGVI